MRRLKDVLKRKTSSKAVLDACKKVKICPHCNAQNGPVKKKGAMQLSHDVFTKKAGELSRAFEVSCDAAMALNPQISQHLGKAQEDLNPQRVLQLFEAMLDEDCEVL